MPPPSSLRDASVCCVGREGTLVSVAKAGSQRATAPGGLINLSNQKILSRTCKHTLDVMRSHVIVRSLSLVYARIKFRSLRVWKLLVAELKDRCRSYPYAGFCAYQTNTYTHDQYVLKRKSKTAVQTPAWHVCSNASDWVQ